MQQGTSRDLISRQDLKLIVADSLRAPLTLISDNIGKKMEKRNKDK